MSTVVVTGGTGFIGSHTVEQLLHRGFHVRCLIRSNRSSLGWLHHLPIETVRVDLTDVRQLTSAVADAEYVVHIAGITKAKRKADYWNGNVLPTERLLEACSNFTGIKKFCLISSLTAVGPSVDGTLLEETAPCRPITPYAKSKLAAEEIARRFGSKLPITIVRPPAVYGPRDRDIFEMFRWVGYGIKPIIGSRHKTLSLIHAEDLARGIVDVTLSEKTVGETYHLSERAAHSFNELIEFLANIVHRRPTPVRFPIPLLFAVAGIVEAVSLFLPKPAVLSIDKTKDLMQPHWVCSAEKVKRHIGFEPAIPIRDGLLQTYQWYRQQGWM